MRLDWTELSHMVIRRSFAEIGDVSETESSQVVAYA